MNASQILSQEGQHNSLRLTQAISVRRDPVIQVEMFVIAGYLPIHAQASRLSVCLMSAAGRFWATKATRDSR